MNDLAALLTGVSQEQVRALTFPVEFGTVIEDANSSDDLRVKPDSMKVSLSWKNRELVLADGLTLKRGDRVIMVGANNGQDYVVLARISKRPGISRRVGK